MTSTTVSCSAPITSFTALGVTVTESGNSVPDELLSAFLQIGQLEGVVLTVGGVAENLGPVPELVWNPTTGAGIWAVDAWHCMCRFGCGDFRLYG